MDLPTTNDDTEVTDTFTSKEEHKINIQTTQEIKKEKKRRKWTHRFSQSRICYAIRDTI